MQFVKDLSEGQFMIYLESLFQSQAVFT